MIGRAFLSWVIGGLMACGAGFPVRADTVTIGGTGSATPIVRTLFDAFHQDNPDAALNLVSPPLGSGGGLKALAEGRIDMTVVARPLKPEENAVFGSVFEWAATPFVLASPNGRHGSGFTITELAAVYQGSLANWDSGAPIRLVLRTLDDSEARMLAGMSSDMDKAVRDSAQRPGMVIAMDDLEAVELIARTPNALGGTSLGLLRSVGVPVSAFPINGVTPSVQSLKDGSYPWRKTLWVVLPKEPSRPARQFADFLRSDKASSLLARYDYLPVGR
ncbi:PstS family phosphate ABC transporter substrate-binding protein [Telmatospirillum siberiense]|uniref:PBP domain-containing protein n=1 Tax=Telmatospirillum siberiense TaxID=382514 RepID=A0A2N3Q0K6_9PROT|nr:substrate-binding domain-containing protein [Telmatospirillum siberiense]PKU26176.1 hypothetical protein CWS72_03365 [Telmatospirillum siberiense]